METGKSSHQNGTTGFKPELGDSGLPLGEKYPVDDGKESPVSNDNLLQEDTASDTETGLLDGSPQLSKDFKMDSQECVDGDTPDEAPGVTYDGVVKLLGEFGPYQKRVCFLLCLPSISGCIQILMSVFTLAVPGHRCAVPGLANDTWAIQGPGHAAIVNAYIPQHPDDLAHCQVYIDPQYRISNLSQDGNMSYPDHGSGDGNVTGTTTCSRYVYDTSTYTSTVVTQMDLVCEKSLLRSHPQMLAMVGSLVGSQATFLADIWGRKTVLMIAILVHIMASFAITWTTHYPVYLTLMFPIGASVSGMLCTAFVLGLELVGPSKRRWTGYGVMAFWSLGMIILAPIAFFIRDWLIPESPRWLLSKGHVDKAEAIINRAAHANRKTLPAGIMDKISLPGTSHSGKSVLTMCTSKRLVVRYLFIFYIWMVSSLAYYGLSWNVGTLGGSVYVNFLLSGVVELVAIGFCVYALDRVGRRVLNCGLMMLAGVTCTATLFPVLFAPPCKSPGVCVASC
ncbi:hypothetical protein BaRGS_00005530 [Batillaria attramentaria]|uniref:Major facilitator superfamily (MFS) profile domain-containing protein n=1 Tax=Batillaria attramentaria TaxID=370345 RepID=A0ABD0LVT2_9CAEN